MVDDMKDILVGLVMLLLTFLVCMLIVSGVSKLSFGYWINFTVMMISVCWVVLLSVFFFCWRNLMYNQ